MADIETGNYNIDPFSFNVPINLPTPNNSWQTMINPVDAFVPQTLGGLPMFNLPLEGYQDRYFGQGFGYGAGRFIDQSAIPSQMQFGVPQQTIQLPTQRPAYTPGEWTPPAIGTVVQKPIDQNIANIQNQLASLSQQQIDFQNQLQNAAGLRDDAFQQFISQYRPPE